MLRWSCRRRVASAPVWSTYEVTCRCDSPVRGDLPGIPCHHQRRTSPTWPWLSPARRVAAALRPPTKAAVTTIAAAAIARTVTPIAGLRSAVPRPAPPIVTTTLRVRRATVQQPRRATSWRNARERPRRQRALRRPADLQPPWSIARATPSRDYRDRDYYVNIGSLVSRRDYYAPVHYDYWARRYYPLESDRLCAVVADLRVDRVFEFRLLRRCRSEPVLLRLQRIRLRVWTRTVRRTRLSQPYGYPHIAGGVRLKIRPRDAQVFVDGYYAGLRR